MLVINVPDSYILQSPPESLKNEWEEYIEELDDDEIEIEEDE